MARFEPRIISFLCNWCSYAGADLCGVSRYQYPPNTRVVRVMCSTRISPQMVLRVLLEGADGVLIGGCHLGDCHYISGNYYTEKRFDIMIKMLQLVGLESERVRLEWISAAEGEKFSKVVTEFTTKIRDLGPNPVKDDKRLAFILEAAEAASQSFRLTALASKEYNLTSRGNVYGEKLDQKKLQEIVTNVAREEFERALILLLTKRDQLSARDLSKKIGVPSDRVLDHIVELKKRNLIEMEYKHGTAPLYRAIPG